MLGALIRTIRPTTIRVARTLAMTAEQKEEITNLVKADKVVVSRIYSKFEYDYKQYALYAHFFIKIEYCANSHRIRIFIL